MKLVTMFLSLTSVSAFAGGSDTIPVIVPDATNCVLPSVVPSAPSCSAPKTVHKKSIKRSGPTKPASPTQTQSQSSEAEATSNSNATVVVNLMAPQPKYNLDLRTTKIAQYKPNRLLLLGGLSKTMPYAITDDCGCSAQAKTKREFDIGAMYLRDVGMFSVGAAATWNGGLYLAAGINW